MRPSVIALMIRRVKSSSHRAACLVQAARNADGVQHGIVNPTGRSARFLHGLVFFILRGGLCIPSAFFHQ